MEYRQIGNSDLKVSEIAPGSGLTYAGDRRGSCKMLILQRNYLYWV